MAVITVLSLAALSLLVFMVVRYRSKKRNRIALLEFKSGKLVEPHRSSKFDEDEVILSDSTALSNKVEKDVEADDNPFANV